MPLMINDGLLGLSVLPLVPSYTRALELGSQWAPEKGRAGRQFNSIRKGPKKGPKSAPNGFLKRTYVSTPQNPQNAYMARLRESRLGSLGPPGASSHNLDFKFFACLYSIEIVRHHHEHIYCTMNKLMLRKDKITGRTFIIFLTNPGFKCLPVRKASSRRSAPRACGRGAKKKYCSLG